MAVVENTQGDEEVVGRFFGGIRRRGVQRAKLDDGHGLRCNGLMSSLRYLCVLVFGASTVISHGQSLAKPWGLHGHDAQHSGISKTESLAINQVRWQMPIDLQPQYSGTTLYAHYGSPMVTRGNTVITPVKTGANDGFRVDARDGANGMPKWTMSTSYSLPPHGWVPPLGIALTPKGRLVVAGGGGTVFYLDGPDTAVAPVTPTGQLAFYGLSNYQASPSSFDVNVKISTPITVDRYGNLFFGFRVLGATTPSLQSGIARIDEDGTGSWVAATTAAADGSISQVAMNCAPALSNDHKTLYIAVSTGNFGSGYLLALNSRTLATQTKVRLMDVKTPTATALVPDDGTACPTVGPDGDVYYGVLESGFTNHFRGWMLHFNADLTQKKTPGAFGWDDTASIVPRALVPSYSGTSKYLILTKYNNYAGAGGNGINRLAILDPNTAMVDPISNCNVMNEVITVASPTLDDEYSNIEGAVREWCINTSAIDPFTKSAIAACEDGKVYRWNFATNTLSPGLRLTDGIGQAYTPSVIGVDGTVYAIANATLFALKP